ncbi:hypothetical protein [Candidatus Uabimicrobium amorphum]|uniref:IcmF-related N-terminal domain-containing protein n=1 Tax=Uabimicrobium amorphum TaxID=2596890 RepID=A0A5S9F5U1_UABAM|nr:hypothetical protein [Candidatus Uabimicrobium amorphum]BBM86671.1 hypothetical protein UABAM_05057 [Candidatus Uabimicrobium amorphum]
MDFVKNLLSIKILSYIAAILLIFGTAMLFLPNQEFKNHELLAMIFIAVGNIYLLSKFIFEVKDGKAAAADQDPFKSSLSYRRLSSLQLYKLWKMFQHNIPAELRRTVLFYQPVIVLGSTGSGKSQLIKNYSGWQSMSQQFFPNFQSNGELDIYLGKKVLVQSISGSLLHNNSPQAKKALADVWESFCTFRKPIIIVAISVASAIEPEKLMNQMAAIRNKINILSSLQKTKLQIRVVLTSMESVAGYREFSLLTHNQSFQFSVEDLDDCEKLFGNYISQGLVKLETPDYQKLLSFFEHISQVLVDLKPFLGILADNNPLSHALQIDSIYFTSSSGDSISAPFDCEWPSQELLNSTNTRQQRRALIICGLLMVAGLIFLSMSYFNRSAERGAFEKMVAAIHLYYEKGGDDNIDAVQDIIYKNSKEIADYMDNIPKNLIQKLSEQQLFSQPKKPEQLNKDIEEIADSFLEIEQEKAKLIRNFLNPKQEKIKEFLDPLLDDRKIKQEQGRDVVKIGLRGRIKKAQESITTLAKLYPFALDNKTDISIADMKNLFTKQENILLLDDAPNWPIFNEQQLQEIEQIQRVRKTLWNDGAQNFKEIVIQLYPIDPDPKKVAGAIFVYSTKEEALNLTQEDKDRGTQEIGIKKIKKLITEETQSKLTMDYGDKKEIKIAFGWQKNSACGLKVNLKKKIEEANQGFNFNEQIIYVRKEGPWSYLRVLNLAKAERFSKTRWKISWTVGGDITISILSNENILEGWK